MSPSSGVAVACIVLMAASCAPCRQVCRSFRDDVAALGLEDEHPMGGADDVIIRLSEVAVGELATELVERLDERWRAALPRSWSVPLLGSVALIPRLGLTEVRLEPANGDAGLRLSLAMAVDVSGGGLAAGVRAEASLRLRMAVERHGDGAVLLIRGGDSRLDGLRLQPTGLASFPAARQLTQWVESSIRAGLAPDVLSQMGDIGVLVIDPVEVSSARVRLVPNRLVVEDSDPSPVLTIGLAADLPGRRPPPRMDPPVAGRPSDVEVWLTAAAAPMLLNALLASDAGFRPSESGGEYHALVQSLTPGDGLLTFVYTLYRTVRPCLIAEFEGRARVHWTPDGADVVVERHELRVASRFEEALAERQPDVEALSRELTGLLRRALTTTVARAPDGEPWRLEPVDLAIDSVGYVVSWRLIPSD